MAKTTLKPTVNIKSSFTTIGAGFSKANKSVSSMRSILLKRTKIKRNSIAGQKSLFSKRIQNQRRKDQEAIVEASRPAGVNKIGKTVLDSGKGLFDRIMDFIGTLLVGWLVNNLPTILTLAQNLMIRIQRVVRILGRFMYDIGGIFTGSTQLFGAILKNIVSLDFFDTKKRVSKALGELESVFDDMDKQFDDGMKSVTTPLGEMPGEKKVPPTGTDYTTTPGSEGGGAGGNGGGGGYSGPGIKFNISQLVKLAQQVGFKGNNAAIAAAVAMAESGGKSDAHNTKPPDNSYGLWQINMIGELGPARRKQYGLKNNEELFDPVTNGKVAYKISGGSNFAAWTTYTSGKYLAFLPDAQKALSSGSAEKAVIPTQQAPKQNLPNQSLLPKSTGAQQQTSSSGGKGGKVIEYLTGDRTSPRYRADHAAGNYHDHLAFDNQATRDAAIKFLTGKGWTIGSVDTGKHAAGSYHYSKQAFDIPFYPNQSKKGVTDDAKGETALSSKLRADLIAGGFSGPQLGGGSGGASPAASVASVASAPPSLPSTKTGQQVMVMDDRPAQQSQQPQQAAPSGGGQAPPPQISSENVLNNLMRNYLLLDLAYT